jgi:hypothetical protein
VAGWGSLGWLIRMPQAETRSEKADGLEHEDVGHGHRRTRYHKAVNQMSTSEATSGNIRVRAQAESDPNRSRPQQSLWFFLYTVSITNEGHDAVQLISRHWVITDRMGKVEEVQGLKSTRYGRNLSIQTTIGPRNHLLNH